MNIICKGLKLGKLIITTEAQLTNAEINMSAEEVVKLFSRGIKENKIVIKKKCIHCKEDLDIRNPTGKCDHLYYPEYIKSNEAKNDV